MSIATFPDRYKMNDRREDILLSLAFVFVSLACVGILIAPSARMGEWQALGSRAAVLVVLPVWAGGAWLVRGVLRRRHPNRDPILFPLGMFLAGWGLLIVWRVLPGFGIRQTGWFLTAVLALVAVLRSPRDLKWLRKYRPIWLGAGILLILLTLFFGTNPSGGEPRLWLGCCGIYFQPSEPLRLLLIAFLASFFSEDDPRQDQDSDDQPRFRLAPVLVVWGLAVALLIVQRDLGTGTLFVALLAVSLYLATGRRLTLILGGAIIAVGAVLGYALYAVVRSRLDAWINPWIDPLGNSYQIVQSLIAVAAGGVFGRGPGLGSPGFVPAVHTDFIFAAAAEEWGFLGGVAILALLALLVGRGLRVAVGVEDRFSGLFAAGLATALGLQAILIIGGVIRVLPLTGVTLPFISYGGSSLVTSFVALGFLVLLSGGRGGISTLDLPVRRMQMVLSVAWIVLALGIGWWGIIRAPDLVSRGDNLRRGLASLYVQRGRILDRDSSLLAESTRVEGLFHREYPLAAAASLIGYDSLFHGRAGLERSMDPVLRGEEGNRPWEVRWHHLLVGMPPEGLDVRLTLDSETQFAAYEALAGHHGAVVIIDTQGGDILALASAPTFDPNSLEDDWDALSDRLDAPLLLRPTQGLYQPGAAMAPLVMAWAQAKGIATLSDPAADMFDPVDVDGGSLECAGARPEGAAANMAGAIVSGCPAPIARIGEQLGAQGLAEMIIAFRLNVPPQIRLESVEIVPREVLPEAGKAGAAAIGQENLTVTPLSLARAMAALGNQGVLPALRLVDAIRTPQGDWELLPALDGEHIVFDPEIARRLIEGLGDEDQSVEVVATALVGEEGKTLAWYLGLFPRARRLVLVVLEDADPAEARLVGEAARVVLGVIP